MLIIKTIIESQRVFFEEGKTKDIDFRIKQLEKLKELIIKYEEEILEALRKDLNKSKFEAYVTEIGMIVQEINHTIKKLPKWAKAKRARTPIAQAISTSKIHSSPYGVVLIISPWNYPFQLTMAPLIGAIAAGNCVVLKPSPYSENTSQLMAKIIEENFEKEYVAIFQGGREVNEKLLEEKWDYIFFTGSPGVGRVVMEAASKDLTPVTLELGGKSPCIVDETADIELAGKRITWGKLINSGQTCVAPDYILVHKKVKDELIKNIKKYITQFYGEEPLENPDYPKIINQKHFNRLLGLIKEEEIIFGGKYNESTRQIEPTILDNVEWENKIMEEEIFGPFFPILEFEDLDHIIHKINSRPSPLSLYLFTTSKENEGKVIKNTKYGGGCINDTIVHLATTNMPFGGVGNSGMGSYHGKWSFDTFSYKKSMLKKSNILDLHFRYPPFDKGLGLIKKVMR